MRIISNLLLWRLGLSIVAVIGCVYAPVAMAKDFAHWVQDFRREAVAQGIKPDVFDGAFANVTPIDRVIELDRKQPERSKQGFSVYLSKVMSQKRIDDGRSAYTGNQKMLRQVSAHYGVPSEVLVSLWGVETSYGKNTGGYDVIAALATLAWEGRRAEFFKKELLNALKILQGNHISRSDFKGSWAGAMGQNQFMPSSWKRFAVDFNSDGHRDIWTTKADVFASSANYLATNGWDKNIPWGWAVEAPLSVQKNKHTQPYLQWLQAGVRFKGHPPTIAAQTPLKMIVPDGGGGRVYLVTRNYDVIMTWNKSTYFALTVGLLSDLIAKGHSTYSSPAADPAQLNP